jgi:5-methylcytosine-specific restriction endonuclease McrA
VIFEVDHKIAIVNGGGEFDVENLQVLCKDCHISKTKSDMKTARGIMVDSGDQTTLGVI